MNKPTKDDVIIVGIGIMLGMLIILNAIAQILRITND